MKGQVNFRHLENVYVRVLIRGYDRKMDCPGEIEASCFTDKEKISIIKLVQHIIKKRIDKIKKSGENK